MPDPIPPNPRVAQLIGDVAQYASIVASLSATYATEPARDKIKTLVARMREDLSELEELL